ncbi:hypothetical protein QUC31_002752 [Theobroma cacao]
MSPWSPDYEMSHGSWVLHLKELDYLLAPDGPWRRFWLGKSLFLLEMESISAVEHRIQIRRWKAKQKRRVLDPKSKWDKRNAESAAFFCPLWPNHLSIGPALDPVPFVTAKPEPQLSSSLRFRARIRGEND